MSSLASQLNSIAATSGSVVLDRKRRQTIHSASLIFEPKVAATQDYTEILNHSLDALYDLEQINPIFGKFRSTLFSETSITIDRNVQTKDQIRDLDNAINMFLSLVAPYWNSPLSYNAVEWLVRRFHIQIHNAEALLLSALPFYNSSIFVKIISITPKFPPLFSWLIGLKKSGRTPTREGLINSGFSDVEFCELYMNYLDDVVSRRFVYPNQLVFFVSSMVGALSRNSTNEIFLEKLSGKLMKVCARLLDTDKVETQVAANTIIVVLANTLPLSQGIIDRLVRSVLHKPKSKGSALTAIYKIYQTIPNVPDQFPQGFDLLCKLINENGEVSEELIILLNSDTSNCYKLLVSIFRRLLLENKFESLVNWKEYAKHVKFNYYTKIAFIKDIIIASRSTFEDNSHIIDFINYLSSSEEDKKLFLTTLAKNKYSVDELEMNLQSVLSNLKANEVTVEPISENTVVSKDVGDKELEILEEFISKSELKDSFSFLLLKKDIDEKFKKLNQYFIRAINLNLLSDFMNGIFGKRAVLCTTTFLLRVSISQNTPTLVRIEAIKNLTSLVEKLQKQCYLITIFPIVLSLLSDPIKSIRSSILPLFKIFATNSEYLKSNLTLAENMFLKDEIFGIENSAKISALNPKDALKLINELISNFESFSVDSTQFFKVFESSIFTSKKIGDITLAYLADNSQIINSPYVKISLMMLVRIGTKTIKDFTTSSHIYNDFLNEYLAKRPFWKIECLEANFDFSYFENSVLNLLNLEKHSKSENKKHSIITSLSFLQKALNSEYQELVDLSVIKLISSFSKLKVDYQTGLAQSIVENSTSSDINVLYDPLEVLQSLPLSNEIFVKLFKNFQLYNNNASANELSSENVPKRRRRSSTSTRQQMKKTEVTKLAEIHLRNVIILLETFEKVGVNLIPSSELLTGLFKLMSDLETLGEDGNLPVLYAQESLANCLLICIKNAEAHKVKLESNSIRADVLVSIIRSSNSPQLQNRLLLIIAELAILEPEFILHSIMPIFTFMGAFTVKQDDEYSSYVIEQTISKVIPALAANASSNENRLEEVEFLLTSFISAFNHIPRHRRVNLFTTLSQILGSQNSIHIILFLIGKQYSRASVKHKYNECMMLVEFVKSFMKNFEISDQLMSIKNFMDLWSYIPNKAISKKTDEFIYNEISSRPIFGEEIANLSDFDMLLFKKNLVSFIDRSIITDAEYNRHSLPYLKLQVTALLLDSRAEKSKIDSLLDVFNQLITSVLSKLTSPSRKVNDEGDELFEISKKIDRKFYRLLNDCLSLLPVNYFVEAIEKLFDLPQSEKNIIIISNIIYLASRQFETESTDFEIAIHSANDLFSRLVDIIIDYQARPNAEIHEIIQNAMDTLSSLVDKFREKIDNGYLIRVLNALTVISSDKVSFINNFNAPELIISSLNLISNIVSVIGIKSIGFFPKIIIPSIKVFEQSKKTNDQVIDISEEEEEEVLSSDQLIQTSVVLLYSCFIKKMPQLLSSHLKTILLQLLNQNLIKKEIKLSVLNIVFTNIPLKNLFNVLISIWNTEEFDKKSASTIGLFLNLLTQTIENIDRSTAVRSVGLFTNFLISSFDFVKNNDEGILNRNAISRIESLFFTCELQFIMKLKDAIFRPVFSSAVSWAFEDNEFGSEENFIRISIFLKFFNKLQDNLKSLITSYYTYIIDYVYQLLDIFTSEEPSNAEYIINTKRLLFISLNNSFKYDNEDYWTVHTRFEKISTGLTKQLAVTENKLGKHLTKTITTLTAKNSKNPEHNKSINKLLIDHLHVNCNSQEKFFAIKVFESIYSKVGTSWMSLLPQLVPVIAELLDDDDEKIEMEVRSGLVKVIEDVLGESLDKYLV